MAAVRLDSVSKSFLRKVSYCDGCINLSYCVNCPYGDMKGEDHGREITMVFNVPAESETVSKN